MADDLDAIKKAVAETKLTTGFTEMSVEDLALATTRLGSLMLDVGQRTWILYYAAKAGNWRFAQSQYRELGELFQLAGLLRPDYAQNLEAYSTEDWSGVGKAIEATDFDAFDAAFNHAIAQANAYHEATHRSYIRWKLPDTSPPGLDLEPREDDRTLGGWSRGGGEGRGGGGGRPGGEGGGGRPH